MTARNYLVFLGCASFTETRNARANCSNVSSDSPRRPCMKAEKVFGWMPDSRAIAAWLRESFATAFRSSSSNAMKSMMPG